ncbi:vacuolar amino acid transporter 1 isoform X1 [Sesamum indicum]|uniref:Vacuolar amino acid transporter 1 isoform X1 n=2 Tax=Sesamum indicum TaxID=4182 RepID=A0A6I9TSN9_SESIN|nr:vacuolar amino acid transporter 1 isoform X1 [Sesamum indicum]
MTFLCAYRALKNGFLRHCEKMMKNSVSDQSFYIESEEEDEEKLYDKDEDNGAGNDSDSSHYSTDNDNENRQQSKPNSLNPSWPQSYRQSIDLYSSVPSPSLNFLGTPTLSRLSSSFLSSSLTRRHTPEILPSLSKPLIPPVEDEKPKERRSSHSLLPPIPSRKPSLKKVTPDGKVSVSHELPISRHSSYGQAVLNGMNVLCGVGILSTPYAVKEGGWLGLSILLTFAVLSYYTGILLRSCLDSQPGLETYPDIGQAAFGTTGRVAISIILYVELYACCVEYIILESDNLSSLFPNAHLNFGAFELNSHHLFAVMTALAVLPTVWLRDMSVLSYISAGGVIASILVVACLFWVGLVDQVGFQTKGTTLNLSTLPVAIGLYGYCYSGHAIFPNIYTSMAKPSQYPAVLLTSFAICTVMYAAVAVLGYMMFGESTQSQFTLNMPQDLVASKIALWTTVVNPFTKYALTMSPVAMSLEELIPSSHAKSYMYSILIRTALVISTLLVGLSIPFFGLVMALIGSLLTMLVTLILPCACYLSILRGKINALQGSMCILVIGVGVVSSAFGTYSALSKIVQSLS